MLSVVVVVHGMARELPRTLLSLAPNCQRGVDAEEYEIGVVDNGSPCPIDEAVLAAFPGRFHAARVEPAPAAPSHAANAGLEMAAGEVVGLIIDGAGNASPGLLAIAKIATALADRPIVATPRYHLGSSRHMEAREPATTSGRRTDCSTTSTGRSTATGCSRSAHSPDRPGGAGSDPKRESSALFMLRET